MSARAQTCYHLEALMAMIITLNSWSHSWEAEVLRLAAGSLHRLCQRH